MTKIKRIVMVVLSIIISITIDCIPVQSSTVSGKTETNAIELKLGKTKTSKFWTGSASSLYYVVALPSQGKLTVSVAAESLGTNVTVEIRKTDIFNWKQEKKISYNKKKKKTVGTITSENILPKGNYIIQITPGKVINKTKKISVTADFTASNFEDIEPNNSEDTAQQIKVNSKSPSYTMYLSNLNLFEDQDSIDCMKFTLKSGKTVTITLKSKAPTEYVKLLLREKSDDGYSTIKSFDVTNGKLSEKVKLSKGTYYIKVWNTNDSVGVQIPYTIKCSI